MTTPREMAGPLTDADLSGWGRYPKVLVRQREIPSGAAAIDAVASAPTMIARGNGRAYGDAALNVDATLVMLRCRNIRSFDALSGRITCDAGLLLADLIAVIVPQGWFVPVTPGTRFVSIGGMLAADVHGKNHHAAGCFGDHVESAELLLADGRILRCGPRENADLFAATRGGMGLTGIILAVTFQLIRIATPYIRQETHRAANLAEVMSLIETSGQWTYSVAWIDCLARGGSLGRSVLFLGEHAHTDEAMRAGLDPTLRIRPRPARKMPFDLPGFVLNAWSVRAFNAVYFRRARPGTTLVDYDTYFYPLDAILNWNRLYGRAGFVQFQCVFPKAVSANGLGQTLERVAASGLGSFLAVLKLFGPQDGLLSFPMEGYTLTLDFPVRDKTFALLRELDTIVAAHRGRVYLAKDACMSPTVLREGYPKLAEFQAIRRRYDPARRFTSVQSERLGI